MRLIEFHVIKTNTSFVLNLADINRLEIYFNNVENILFMIIKNKDLSMIRRFDHDFLQWKNSYSLHSYIAQSFNFYLCYLIDIELCQLHRRFEHSFIMKLHDLLKRFDHEVKRTALKKLLKFCIFCQKYTKSCEHFKFTLKDDANCNFNYSMIVNIMYIENHLILHIVDDATCFQIANQLQIISAKHIWDMLCLCWIDVYLNSSDHILIDADKNFASREFRQFVISMTIITKAVLVEARWLIDVVKRYHAELRRAYQMIFEKLDVNKKIALQMIVKAISDTIDSDDLVFILLIFEVYSRIHVMNSSILSTIQRTIIIEKVMIKIRKVRAERQIIDVLNTRNNLIMISIHDLLLNSNVLIWHESNVNQRDKWIELFKLLNIDDETCKIVLSSESIEFRSSVIKSFLIESINDAKSIDGNVQLISEDVQSSDHQNNLSAKSFEITRSLAITRSIRARRLSLRYQNVADIIFFLQDENPHSNQFEDVLISFIFMKSRRNSHLNQFEDVLISILILLFMKSRRKEVNDVLKKRVFELIIIEAVSRDARIFNFRFVNEIKHSDTSDAYKKFRLVIQTYNDHDKTLMLTQSFTIQRMSQRIILVLTVIIKHSLYLRVIIQTYVQSKISLNKEFFIRSLFELDLSKNSILRVVKPLYDVLETETHWFNTYQNHHKKRLLSNSYWLTKEWIANCCLFNLERKSSSLYRNLLLIISSTNLSM
jgi:hypothetical protein